MSSEPGSRARACAQGREAGRVAGAEPQEGRSLVGEGGGGGRRLPELGVERGRLDVAPEAQQGHPFGEARRPRGPPLLGAPGEGLERRRVLALLGLQPGRGRGGPRRRPGRAAAPVASARACPWGSAAASASAWAFRASKGTAARRATQHLARAGGGGGPGEGDVEGQAGRAARAGCGPALGPRAERRARPAATSSRRTFTATSGPARSTVLVTSRHAPTASATRMAVARLSRTGGQPQALLHPAQVVALEGRHPQLGEGPRQLVGHGISPSQGSSRRGHVRRRHHHGPRGGGREEDEGGGSDHAAQLDARGWTHPGVGGELLAQAEAEAGVERVGAAVAHGHGEARGPEPQAAHGIEGAHQEERPQATRLQGRVHRHLADVPVGARQLAREDDPQRGLARPRPGARPRR